MNNFYLPAEWYPQDAVLMTWPHAATDWQPLLEKVEPAFINIAKAITDRQKLIINCHNENLQQHIKAIFKQANIKLEQVNFVLAASNDTWARDHGPITLVNHEGKIKCLNFIFNGWGNKFEASLDNQLNLALFQQLKLTEQQQQSINLVLEGGGIESDGQGHLLTTSKCLLNPNRNPALTKQDIETQLCSLFASKKVLWLDSGDLIGDDTDAHIDTLCRFAPNNSLVYVRCDDENDAHFAELAEMEKELQVLRTLDNQTFNLIPLPWPSAKFNQDGDRLPATYANYLIINQAVLVPTYQDKADETALRQIQLAYPEHEVIAIDCLAVIEQFGSLHCLTMQLPKGVLPA